MALPQVNVRLPLSFVPREGSVGCRSEIGDNCGKQAGGKGENRVPCSDGNTGDAQFGRGFAHVS